MPFDFGELIFLVREGAGNLRRTGSRHCLPMREQTADVRDMGKCPELLGIGTSADGDGG